MAYTFATAFTYKIEVKGVCIVVTKFDTYTLCFVYPTYIQSMTLGFKSSFSFPKELLENYGLVIAYFTKIRF